MSVTGEDMDSITKRESQKRRKEKDALQKLEQLEGGSANASAAGGIGKTPHMLIHLHIHHTLRPF
jgi:hypothetical protein